MRESSKQKKQTLTLDDISKLSPAARKQIEAQLGGPAGEFIELANTIKKEDLKAVKDLSNAIKEPKSTEKEKHSIHEHSLSVGVRKTNSLLVESVKLQSQLLKEIRFLNKFNTGTTGSRSTDEKVIHVQTGSGGHGGGNDYTGWGVLSGADPLPHGYSHYAMRRRHEMQAAERAALGGMISRVVGTPGVLPAIGGLGMAGILGGFNGKPTYEGGDMLTDWTHKHIPGMRWFDEKVMDPINRVLIPGYKKGDLKRQDNYALEFQSREIERLRQEEAFRKLQKDQAGVYNSPFTNIQQNGIPQNSATGVNGYPSSLPGGGGGVYNGGPVSPQPGGGSVIGGNAAYGTAMKAAMDQLRKEGVPEANVKAAAALLVGQAVQESKLNPNAVHDNGTGYGIYGARLDRRSKMLAWLAQNGYSQNSLEGQSKYMAHEAMTEKRFATTRDILMKATPETFATDTPVITRNFESPNPAVANNPNRLSGTQRAFNIGDNPNAKDTINADGQGPVQLGPGKGVDEAIKSGAIKPNGRSGSQAHIDQLNPDVKARLTALGEAYQKQTGKPLPINSANRSYEEQAELYRRGGPYPVARPGHSKHEGGKAFDIPRHIADQLEADGTLDRLGLYRLILTILFILK